MFAGCAGTRSAAPIRERGPAPLDKPAPLKPAPNGYYRIQPGDSLYKIAFEQGLDYRDLALWNNLAEPDRIRAGDLLRLTAPAIAKPAAAIPVVALQEGPPDTWSWPLRGPLLARFGEGLNKGIDIAGSRGQLVQAAAAGRVVYAGSGLRGYGKLIIIRHGRTLLSAYAHNSRILVTDGQNVARGQVVSEIGDSDTDRVKLHFEIRELGKPVDPLNYLPNAG